MADFRIEFSAAPQTQNQYGKKGKTHMDMIPTAKDIRGPSPLVPIENEAPAKSGTRSCCNRKEAKRADRGEFVIAVDEQNALFVRSHLKTAVQPTSHALPLFRRILVPTDFSQRSRLAIDYAVELARRMNRQLTLLHVIPEPSALDYNMGGFPPEELAQAEEEAKQKLAAELAHAKVSLLEVDSKLQTGVDLHDEILSTAKQYCQH